MTGDRNPSLKIALCDQNAWWLGSRVEPYRYPPKAWGWESSKNRTGKIWHTSAMLCTSVGFGHVSRGTCLDCAVTNAQIVWEFTICWKRMLTEHASCAWAWEQCKRKIAHWKCTRVKFIVDIVQDGIMIYFWTCQSWNRILNTPELKSKQISFEIRFRLNVEHARVDFMADIIQLEKPELNCGRYYPIGQARVEFVADIIQLDKPELNLWQILSNQ